MPKQVSALLCVVEPDLEEILTNYIKEVLPSDAVPTVMCVKTLDEIMILSIISDSTSPSSCSTTSLFRRT